LPDELPRLLASRPGAGAFSGPTLRAFMLATSVVGPSAWLGGFGVIWDDRHVAFDWLDTLGPFWYAALRARGATAVYYTGNGGADDWLYTPLLARGYRRYADLRSYDKDGVTSSARGNQQIIVRPFDPQRDLDAVLAIEAAAFTPPWRHDAAEFREIAATYPFFVVATTPAVVGYQFSATEGELGFLVRIAVAPDRFGQGIGARLMAEALRYFAAAGVRRVLLNAEETNTRAHRLYERFGFTLVEPRGFVLAHALAPVTLISNVSPA
jgi:GNAT superfamily N-acetyltransferase